MDEIESHPADASSSKAAEEAEMNEDDIDLKEVIQLDEILSSSGGSVKMLDYERQMFLDCVYNDGLVICGK